jgi:hypothetical protein
MVTTFSSNLSLERKKKKPKKTIIDEVKRKEALINNKFIETSQNCTVKNGTPSPAYFDINKDDNSSLMTETLARYI